MGVWTLFPRGLLSAPKGVSPCVFSVQGGTPLSSGETLPWGLASAPGRPFLGCLSSALSGTGHSWHSCSGPGGFIWCDSPHAGEGALLLGPMAGLGAEHFLVSVPALRGEVSWVGHPRAAAPSPLAFPHL